MIGQKCKALAVTCIAQLRKPERTSKFIDIKILLPVKPLSSKPRLKGIKMDMKLITSRYKLKLFDSGELVHFAELMLENDFNSASLREVAWGGRSFTEKLTCFGQALNELGIDLPSTERACMTMATQIAQEVIHGGRDAYDGAREIWWKLYNPNKTVEELKRFVGLASEYEDQPSLKNYYEAQLRMGFRALLELQGREESSSPVVPDSHF